MDKSFDKQQEIEKINELVKNRKIQGIPAEIELSNDERVAAWQRLQYGMFIHWGLYSKIGGVWDGEPVKKGYSEQVQMWADIPEQDYLKVAENFTAESFDPVEICSLAKEAGMSHIMMTSKHHDGFCMFDTDTTDYNIVKQTPYGQDPLKLLAEECQRQGLKFGIYFSLVDWHQGHQFDEGNNNPIPASIEEIIEKQLKELMTNYGPICEIWFDMSSPTQEQSKKFIDIVRDHQPGAMINSRIWNNMGDFRTLGDNEVPSVKIEGAWEIPASIYQETWGYRQWQERKDLQGKVKELLTGLVGGGNYLLNIGPRGDGSIIEFEADVLRTIGQWLGCHPFAALGSSASCFDGQSWGTIRVRDHSLYLILSQKPTDKKLMLHGILDDVNKITEDGTNEELPWSQKGGTLSITLPDQFEESILPVISVQLKEKPHIIPEKTVALKDNGDWNIDADDFYHGYGYEDDGNYDSMHQTTISYTAFLLTEEDCNVSLDLKGNAVSDRNYKIEIGKTTHIVKGDQLTSSEIGSFEIPGNQITPFSVTRAEPEHTSEDIGFSIQFARLFKNTN